MEKLLLLVTALVLAAACTGPGGGYYPSGDATPPADASPPIDRPRACVPGMTVECACGGGATGSQTCTGDGQGFGACVGCPAPDAGPACPSSQTLCGGLCVNTQTDGQNCGACGVGCAAGMRCEGGACASGCPAPRLTCAGACVDPATDARNCGMCGVACPSGAACSGGGCSCVEGRNACGGRCVDLATDASNCGACGNRCASGMCAAGACVAPAMCSIGEGAACSPGNPAPACCGDGRLCADNGLGGNACCRSAGGSCEPTVPRGAGCCGAAVCQGGVCVLPPTCGGAGMPCGAGCCTGLTCSGGTCNAPSRVSVVWNFDAVLPDGRGGMFFPSYIAHLFASAASVTHPLIRPFACATITNAGGAAQTVALTVRFGSYLMMDATLSVSVAAGRTETRCPPVAFNFEALRRLSVTTPGVISATARDSGGAEVANTNLAVGVMPLSSILVTTGPSAHDVYDLAAVAVQPPQVRSILTQVSRASTFNGGFGDAAYRRASLTHPTTTIAARTWSREALYLEAGESVVLAAVVAGGRDNAVNAYLFTDAQYTAWLAGVPDTRAVGAFLGITSSTPASVFTAPAPGIHHLVLHNVATDGSARSVQWVRDGTRQEVATDALRAIYTVLRGFRFTYSNIPADYFGAVGQHVRTPAEALASVGTPLASGMNCIDGTVLFASLLELIGMEPVMFTVQRPRGGGGHAYVGVKARPRNYAASDPAMFSAPATIWTVETTMLGTADFWDAFAEAGRERARDIGNVGMPGADYHEVDVATLRRRGITPTP